MPADAAARRRRRNHHAVPTIKRYVIIEQVEIAVTVNARQGEEPWATLPYGKGSVLNLPEIGVRLPVDLLYRDVDFAEAEDASRNADDTP